MKAKITRGRDFRGLLNYVFDAGSKAKGNKQPELIGGNMAEKTPQSLNQAFTDVRRLRPDIDKPVWHCSLTLPEGERLNSQEWAEVAQEFMEKMEFSEATPYVAVRHNDTDHDHIHIVTSRIDPYSNLWYGQHELPKSIEATQALEKAHNLTQTLGYKSRAERQRETYQERHRTGRTGEESPRLRLQNMIDQALKGKPTAPEFAQRLEENGVEVRANLGQQNQIRGFSFELDGIAFKGSSLGKKYGWGGLQKRGVNYDPERDLAQMERYKYPVSEPTAEPEPTAATTLETVAPPATTIFPVEVEQPESTPTPTAVKADDIHQLRAELTKYQQQQQELISTGKPVSHFVDFEVQRLQEKLRQLELDPLHQEPSQSQIEAGDVLGQQQMVESLCPDLADILRAEDAYEVPKTYRTIQFDPDNQRLTLRENQTDKIVLDAVWDSGKGWLDNGSRLDQEDYVQIRAALDDWQEEQRELARQGQREVER